MWKKIVVITGLSAVALGVGGVVVAESASAAPSTTTAAPTTATHAKAKHKAAERELLKATHAQWTTYDAKTKTFVTHDEIRGLVTAVSPTAVTIKAADGMSETYAVSSSTKLHVKGTTKGQKSTIGQVKVGDRALATGTGTSSLTAKRLLDAGAPKVKTTTAAKPTA